MTDNAMIRLIEQIEDVRTLSEGDRWCTFEEGMQYVRDDRKDILSDELETHERKSEARITIALLEKLGKFLGIEESK